MLKSKKECSIDSCSTINNKYIQEIDTELLSNRLVIRIEKDKLKSSKKKKVWEPPCNCNIIQIKRPTNNKGPTIMNGGDNNVILFRIHSKTHLNKKQDPNHRPKAICYKINKSETENENLRKIMIHPHLDGPVTQNILTHHKCDNNRNSYLLRVKKINNALDVYKLRNFELQLITQK